MTKDDLIDSILSADPDQDTLQVITQQLTTLRTEITALKDTFTSPESAINKRITELQEQVNKQAEIITKQQRFLENIDRKERECNLVLYGVPDENVSLDGSTTDDRKIHKIWEETGASNEVRAVRRLGNRNSEANTGRDRRYRVMLVTLASREDRDDVLNKAKRLKEGTDMYKKIYIKKDVHPSVREEWKRLREAEKKEKEKPENVGCNIYFNARERKLYKDGVVIDSWSVQGF